MKLSQHFCLRSMTNLFLKSFLILFQRINHKVTQSFFFRRKVIRKQVSVLATRLTYICVYLELYPTVIVALPLKYKKQTHSLRYTVFLKCVWQGAEQREMLTQLFKWWLWSQTEDHDTNLSLFGYLFIFFKEKDLYFKCYF